MTIREFAEQNKDKYACMDYVLADDVIAEFKITHSQWMTGTWEENLNYFHSKCWEFLEDEGLIYENAHGFKFLKDGCLE